MLHWITPTLSQFTKNKEYIWDNQVFATQSRHSSVCISYIYMFICVCFCLCTNIHTYIYIYTPVLQNMQVQSTGYCYIDIVMNTHTLQVLLCFQIIFVMFQMLEMTVFVHNMSPAQFRPPYTHLPSSRPI